MTFQPTLPARGATYLRRTLRQHRNYFNPRSPHGERRMTASWKSSGTRFQPTLPARGATGKLIAGSGDLVFQPTLPARGATRPRWRTFRWLFNFNPRSPHGERHKQVWLANRMAFISTHAPRTGSDRMEENQRQREAEISTHAPRTGSDWRTPPDSAQCGNFNSRSPHGERQHYQAGLLQTDNFNPRSPHGERRGRD